LYFAATAGVNSHICLWNPYVVNKPVGVSRAHFFAASILTSAAFMKYAKFLLSAENVSMNTIYFLDVVL